MERTAKTIMESFTTRVSARESIAPDEWLQAAIFLNVLTGEEQYKLVELEQAYTKVQLGFIELGDSNAVAEKKAKASKEFVDYKKQQAFCKQIHDFILLAKKQATISFEQGA